MRIYVCVKQVPDTEAIISITKDMGYDREVKYVVNPYDDYGVEQAVSMVEKAGEGEVIALCVGSERAANALRSAMAMGVDRSILVTTDEQFPSSDLVAQVLAEVIKQEGPADFIFTGKQSVDSEGMQTPYRLGAELGLPVVSGVVSFALEGSTAEVKREIGGGVRETLRVRTPCIIGATKGINEPRYPKLAAILKAKKKEIKTIDISTFGNPGNAGSRLKCLEATAERSRAVILEGGTEEIVNSLINILKAEERVI
jgi:electron transfer flavoprotein beta subunit